MQFNIIFVYVLFKIYKHTLQTVLFILFKVQLISFLNDISSMKHESGSLQWHWDTSNLLPVKRKINCSWRPELL